jgi:hypothetical protein
MADPFFMSDPAARKRKRTKVTHSNPFLFLCLNWQKSIPGLHLHHKLIAPRFALNDFQASDEEENEEEEGTAGSSLLPPLLPPCISMSKILWNLWTEWKNRERSAHWWREGTGRFEGLLPRVRGRDINAPLLCSPPQAARWT